MAMIYGPVAEASHGGHGNPAFDLLIGFAFLIATWRYQYFRSDQRKRVNIWVTIGISCICGVFIWSGIASLL